MSAEFKRRQVWVYPVLALGGTALLWFFALLLVDFVLVFPPKPPLRSVVGQHTAADIQSALGNLPEVVVAILGIAITVVSIIVQLSATRYTPRVTEMFFRDRTNVGVLSFFVLTSIHCIWAAFALNRSFVPLVLVLVTVGMVSAALLLLIPYFVYVFAFLDPERVVARLQQHALEVAVAATARTNTGDGAQVLERVEQLADVAVNAIAQKDRIIASRSIDALKLLVTGYLPYKGRAPQSWFAIDEELRRNPDFTVMAPESVEGLAQNKVWLEFKVLRQYETIFNESVNKMRDTSQVVAINTRHIGEAAVVCGDRAVLQLACKFFNTYLRATINQRDVRTAYNTLHQYRQLAENVLQANLDDEVVEICGYFKYYGQTANAAGLHFITETAAYDMCALCELAHRESFAKQALMLDTFLSVDKTPETEAEERSLRGVRKAQIKLATYYLLAGADEHARRIFADMEHERPERLSSIRDEMLAVQAKDFWEVIDRGHNFDYLDAPRKEKLQVFYSWFASLRTSSSPRNPAI